MKTCPNCRCQINDDAVFCPVCGTTVDGIPNFPLPHQQPHQSEQPPAYVPPEPVFDPYDHTEDFIESDITENKLPCMLVYLLDFVGIIIALLMGKSSQYVDFHVRQSMKFTVVEILIALVALLLCWTVIVPVIALVALVVLVAIKFVSFTQVCSGKAKEPVLIRSMKFLN